MDPRVEQVRYVRDYVLELKFTDGIVAELDFSDDIQKADGIMAPLKDIEYFKQVRVDDAWGCIVWPNEYDYCPDLLYNRATGKPVPFAQPDSEQNPRHRKSA